MKFHSFGISTNYIFSRTEQPALMENIHHKLRKITEQFDLDQFSSFLDMIALDSKDFDVNLKQGSLALDANHYGALFYLLHKQK